MIRSAWPAFVGGKWWIWKPLPGFDPGLGESVYLLAAAKWASVMIEGKPEAIAHQEAEKLAFEVMYNVSYDKH